MADPKRSNVFIVGAGASTNFGLPVGENLKLEIGRLLDFQPSRAGFGEFGDNLLKRTLSHVGTVREYGLSYPDLLRAAQETSSAMTIAPTIDNWIHKNRNYDEFVLVGKLAIARVLSMAERSSPLFVKDDNIYRMLDYNNVGGSWLAGLATQMLTGSDFDDFIQSLSNITFITFNYDRCIEQFFLWLARIYFGEVDNADKRTLDALEVIHVYGSLGDLDTTFGPRTGYGCDLDIHGLLQASEKIHTFTQGVSEENIRVRIHDALSNCEVLTILGFGFDRINFDLLPNQRLEACQRLIVTTRGHSRDDLQTIKEGLHERLGVEPSYNALNASDVFKEYRQFFLGKFNSSPTA
ncbi:hypothetical protein EU803_00990 [Loktanella sp. IMCC34160]|uniref:hypothetical protein n=1 Tax=Loktanella sp. IMCC34160 TaxID=2510646 RepID=UPI00101DF830|nr:hypothetical protein [Loktanella sp. IMCC34160]RYG92714.1 hypothetical protein EU803_00990 [Loktanella sp. IMCC34160]